MIHVGIPRLHVTAPLIYLGIRKVTLRHERLLNIVKDLKHQFSSTYCLVVSTLHEGVLIASNKETAEFLFCATNAVNCQKDDIFFAHTFCQYALSLLSQVRKLYNCPERDLVGSWDQSLAMELSHTKSFSICICTMLLNMLHLFEHDPVGEGGLVEAIRIGKRQPSVHGLQAFSHLYCGGTKLRKDVGASTSLPV